MAKVLCAKYRRISDDREGRELGVSRQDTDLDALAERRGYSIVADYCDNDMGASTRSTRRRPEYEQMLVDARAGAFGVIIAYTSSRLTRRPREHEDLIELAERHGVHFEYVRSPSFDLNTSAGRRIARILAANDAGESEDIAERVAARRLQQAQEGRYGGGGRRPFGYEADGVRLRHDEAGEIVRAADALLSGVSLAQVTASLRDRGVRTVTGAAWRTVTLRQILLRPRNAGLVVHQGEIVEGVTAQWPAILDRPVWEAVRALLTDPRRRTTPGNTPRWLGSGIYRCGHPDCIEADPPVTLVVGRSANGRHKTPRYRHQGREHLTRSAPALDSYVELVVVKRLARPDAADLLAPLAPAGDMAALEQEATALRARIVEAGDLWEDGTLPTSEYRTRKRRLEDRLADVETRQRRNAGRSPLVGIAGRADAALVWKRLDLGRQRAILSELLVVTVLPAPRGRLPDGSRFDPNSIDIQPARRS